MDFRLTADQEQLREGARRFISSELPFVPRIQINPTLDRWRELADMGWLMMAVSESAGGLGSPLQDIALLCEELGRGLVLEPFISAAVLPARLLALSGGTLASEFLGSLSAGECRFAAALYESSRRWSLDDLATTATAASSDLIELNGAKHLVAGGGEARQLIVAARETESNRPILLLLDAKTNGVIRHTYRTVDGLSAADFTFDRVHVSPKQILASPAVADSVLTQSIDEATVLLCADALGCMEHAIELTAEYWRSRRQFGHPLSNFQALQHGLANLFIAANDSRSMVYRALAACTGGASERARAVSACKIKVFASARLVTGQCVHYHGAIGMTCEYSIGDHLRRILATEPLYGNEQHHLSRYMNGKC